MTRLPALRSRQVIRALERAGFVIIRISGSHCRMERKGRPTRHTTVPAHQGKDIPKGTLRDIIDQAGLTVDEFVALL